MAKIGSGRNAASADAARRSETPTGETSERRAERRKTWTWTLPGRPETLWPHLADTMRFNEAIQAPKHQIEELPQADGSMLRIGRAQLGRIALEWEERPFEWVAARWFRQTRVFRKGPFLRFGPELTLRAKGEDATEVSYSLHMAPRGVAGRMLWTFGAIDKIGAAAGRLFAEAAAFARGDRDAPYPVPPPDLPDGAAARLAAARTSIAALGQPDALAAALTKFVATAPEADLMRIQPLPLGRRLGIAPRTSAELLLAAVRARLLDMRWDLLCPRCRGAAATPGGLDETPRGVHCNSCNIDYQRAFDHNVEVTFAPNPAIRPLEQGEFCISGPQTTPHVYAQIRVPAGARRVVAGEPAAGGWRLRALTPGDAAEVDWSGAKDVGFPAIIAEDARVIAGPPAEPGTLRFENRSERELILLVESRDWVADALTAHQLTTLQAFRDLFPTEALRPGDDSAVGSVTLMFTDLKGSTAFYERVGDARAYGVVRDHFALLTRIVREHDGAVVKTIGDAVMAAFAEPADSVRAALAIQRRMGAFRNEAAADVIIKIGLHVGPCIVVTLNDRLDYFGRTVNLAARIQGASEGDDIVLSSTLATDPPIAAMLNDLPPGETTKHETISAKGFDEPIAITRICRREGDAPTPTPS